MSRVHDALRRAAQENPQPEKPPTRAPKVAPPPPPSEEPAPGADTASDVSPVVAASAPEPAPVVAPPEPEAAQPEYRQNALVEAIADLERLEDVIRAAPFIPFDPLPEALLINPAKPRATPAEEFRSLRTRLNHLQTVQPLHSLVVTSPSPAEGKSFTAMNLAVAQAQLAEKRVLLADFDFRRPTIDKTFRISGQAGITDYLQGRARIGEIINRVADSNLYLMTAGGPAANPLELLNLKECRALLDALRNHFDWVIIDTPPLLFAADANLLSTMADSSLLVVRIGSTTFDAVSRAMQSLCENNVLGVVVNGARRGELYSKYTYYHDYYYSENNGDENEQVGAQDAVTVQR
ncbi:MAG: CpsD/CapB family tyrosine-protein kinase [Acidobacteriaceae bacterium]|nr:CpsD/CapB family tyrosine-protein kinase [Acidobacteriaceae bacterium]